MESGRSEMVQLLLNNVRQESTRELLDLLGITYIRRERAFISTMKDSCVSPFQPPLSLSEEGKGGTGTEILHFLYGSPFDTLQWQTIYFHRHDYRCSCWRKMTKSMKNSTDRYSLAIQWPNRDTSTNLLYAYYSSYTTGSREREIYRWLGRRNHLNGSSPLVRSSFIS